jgi:hypothetical protein
MKNHVVFQLVKFLWTTILEKHYSSKPELNEIINEPSQLIFDAAEVGNFEFLSELISVYPSLIWDVDSKNRTILHIAVLHRHASIFHLVHQIGHIKGIIVTYENDDDRNTLLHLAAKLAPRSQLELVSGAAFQMCVELLWFEVHAMQPFFIHFIEKLKASYFHTYPFHYINKTLNGVGVCHCVNSNIKFLHICILLNIYTFSCDRK